MTARLRLAPALGLLGLLALALAIRVPAWLPGLPLHHDEALYGAWARLIATGQDPLLLTTWIDKPPLTFYLIAASQRLFGLAEWSLRLPGMLAAALLVVVTYGFARSAYGARTGIAAALLVALSPFAIAFAPTAFTDGWLALFMLAAAWAALAGQPFLAGLLAGLAVASKQQGVLVVPLVLALLAAGPRRPRTFKGFAAALGLALLGFALILAPLTWWDSLRWHNRPSFWDRSLQTYGGLTLAPAAAWVERALGWAEPLSRFWGLPAWSWAALAVAAAVGLAGLAGRGRTPASRVDLLLGGYTAAYLLLHIVVTFQPWDRYLLPLVPLVCVLVARGLARLASARAFAGLPRRRAYGAAILILLLAYPAYLGAASRLPIGSNGGQYEGVAATAAFIRNEPATAIVYYRRLGWHFDYYLFGAPQERRWYGDAAKLASDAGLSALEEPSRAQWLALPAWEAASLAELNAALDGKGLHLDPGAQVLDRDGRTVLTLYRIVPLAAGEGSA